ncbi:Omp28-related outer membrane protein [Flavobacterium sp.]|uniref:Omp28-related outer membrane protein n=1 Tax=Flavobacterium sp. TaxID=239 RepID=UPI002618ACBD|nr:Omp28-related outer membrane protein [Flavobacterium sp.]MDD2985851.1 Omp28-related outer membrane protein [Flavobacterium sp.]
MKKTLLSAVLLTFGFANAQTFVSTTPENKKAILEEFTGVNCVYCPQGHSIANSIKNNDPNNVFLINIHAGGYANPSAGQPDFRTPFGTAIANQSGLTGYPAGTVNRNVFPGYNQGAVGTTAMSRNFWSNAANQIKLQSSYVNVGVQGVINTQTNMLDVTVEIYYTGNSPVSTNKLNVALLQNNTLGPQNGGNMGNNYNHQHRLVHMITGQWGTDVTSTTNGAFSSQTFSYAIPASYNGIPVEIGDLELVAFVSETQQKIISGNGAKPTFTGLPANDARIKSIQPIIATCLTSIGPKVSIQNMGQTPLTSLSIDYAINGGTNNSFVWTGNLGPLERADVQLPAVAFTPLATNTIAISIPNDDNVSNNTGTLNFNKAVETNKTNIKIKISLDQYGSETSWNLKNSAGAIVAQNPTYTDAGGAGTYPQADVNLTLPNDCYSFTISDAYGDGMCCSYGNGNYQVLADGVLLPGMTGGSYGTGETKNFGVNTNLSVSNFDVSAIKFYPNPTFGEITVSLPEMAKVTLTDLTGKTILNTTLEAGDSTLNLGSLSKGIYLINFAGESFSKTDKVILK